MLVDSGTHFIFSKRISMTKFRMMLACSLALVLTVVVWAGEAVQIKLKDGSTWRGQVSDQVELRFTEQGVQVPMTGTVMKSSDLYIIVEGQIAGQTKQKT